MPLCVPGGIRSTTFLPSTVRTRIREPRSAWARLIGTSQTRFIPSRSKKGSSFTRTRMIRSPDGPPPGPRSPWPEIRTFEPSSTPAGMSTFSFRRLRTAPLPRHTRHGSEGVRPRPMHSGQGRFTENPPWPKLTVPRPSHCWQVSMVEPGAAPDPSQVAHSSVTGTFTVTLPPRTAVRKDTVTSYSTLRPRSGPWRSRRRVRPRPRPPRSKMELKMSPRPPKSISERSSKRNPSRPPRAAPPPRPPVPGRPPVNAPLPPNFRIRSYFWRRSGSERTR